MFSCIRLETIWSHIFDLYRWLEQSDGGSRAWVLVVPFWWNTTQHNTQTRLNNRMEQTASTSMVFDWLGLPCPQLLFFFWNETKRNEWTVNPLVWSDCWTLLPSLLSTRALLSTMDRSILLFFYLCSNILEHTHWSSLSRYIHLAKCNTIEIILDRTIASFTSAKHKWRSKRRMIRP